MKTTEIGIPCLPGMKDKNGTWKRRGSVAALTGTGSLGVLYLVWQFWIGPLTMKVGAQESETKFVREKMVCHEQTLKDHTNAIEEAKTDRRETRAKMGMVKESIGSIEGDVKAINARLNGMEQSSQRQERMLERIATKLGT